MERGAVWGREASSPVRTVVVRGDVDDDVDDDGIVAVVTFGFRVGGIVRMTFPHSIHTM
jgi:hypothetical protein